MTPAKPILFSAPMVRAILDGRKTVTRRVLKPQPVVAGRSFYRPFLKTRPREWHSVTQNGMIVNIQVVPIVEGDLLWVREAFAHVYSSNEKPAHIDPCDIVYRADGEGLSEYIYGTWRSSIHMPRWASRITLRVTGVKVERLQDITDTEALKEGVRALPLQCPDDPSAWWETGPGQNQARTPRLSFADLWQSINGPGSWDANPWVATYTFEVVP